MGIAITAQQTMQMYYLSYLYDVGTLLMKRGPLSRVTSRKDMLN